jgi:hypothetical protein
MDAGEFLSHGASSSVGERAILNLINTNKLQIKNILG